MCLCVVPVLGTTLPAWGDVSHRSPSRLNAEGEWRYVEKKKVLYN